MVQEVKRIKIIVQTLLAKRTVKNAGYMIIGRIIQMVFGLVISLLTARYLGPSNYGLISYAGAYTAFFTSLCTLGINSILVKEFVDHPEEQGVVIGTTLGLRAISSILSSIAIICISCVIDAGEKTTILIVALSSVGMVFNIAETFLYWFQSRLESKITASAALIAYVISSAYKIFLLATGKSVAYFALVSSLDYLCLGILLYIQYRKKQGQKLQFSVEYGKKLLGKSYHFILSGLMVSIYRQTDKLMLKQMINEAETGYYTIASSLCVIWCFILSAIIDSIYPTIMEAAKQKNEILFKKRNIQLYAIVFYVSAAVSIGFTIFARLIIYIMYGESYLPAIVPLRILTWHTAFSYLGVARDAWIVAKDKQKHLFKIYVSAAVANVILNAVFIPTFGASGAAIASLLAQIITAIIVPFFMKEIRENALLMVDAILLKGILWKRESKL